MKKAVALFVVLWLLIPTLSNEVYACYSNNAESDTSIYINTTEFDGIRESANGTYGYQTTNETGELVYVPVNKIEIDLLGEEDLSGLELPSEVLRALKEKMIYAMSNPESRYVVLFAPQDVDEIVEGDMSAGADTDGWTYTKYNGTPMKTYMLFSYSINSKNLTYKDSSAKAKAEALTSLVLTAAGQADQKLGYVTTGLSVFTDLCQYFGISSSVITGAIGDYVEHKFRYDIAEKFTYAQIGQVWKYGYYTQKVTVTYTYVEAYFYSAVNRRGYEKTWENTSSRTQSSANFYSPDAKAYSYASAGSYGAEYTYWQAGNSAKYQFTSSPNPA